MLVFYGNQPVLEIKTETQSGANFGNKYGLNRDRLPDSGWGELQWTILTEAEELEETPKLRQLLLEELAYAYGNNTNKFREKLIEFKFIQYEKSIYFIWNYFIIYFL